MLGRRPQPWFWIGGILLVAVGLGAWAWLSMQPLAKLRLPDGTELRLQEVTNGPEFRYKTSQPSQRGIWARIRNIFAEPNASITLNGPGPHFVFSIQPPNQGKPPSIQKIRTFLDNHAPIEFSFNRSNGPIIWRQAVFPRREKTFRAQVLVGATWHDWELPNPAYQKTFPEWKAEAFPIKRTVGDFEYVAHGWKPGNFGPHLNFDVSYKGKPVKWPVVIHTSMLYTDVTGNEAQALLSSHEPAWKVRQSITTGKQAPLSPEHAIRFPGMKVPQPGEHGMQRVEGVPGMNGKKYLGYVGVGSFQFTDGTPVKLDPEKERDITAQTIIASGAPTVSTSANGMSWTVTGVAKSPSFLIVDEASEGKPTCEYGFMHGGKWKGLTSVVRGFGPSPSMRIGVRQMSVDEPPGAEVEFHVFWSESFNVEMFAKPPPPGMGALKKEPRR